MHHAEELRGALQIKGAFQLKAALVLTTVVILGLSLIRPLFPREQSLQHAPTVIALILLAVGARRNWLTTKAFVAVVAMLWLHILGARYIYSCVPYDDWSTRFTGISISELFGWQRNHYDRLVHLCFGALCMLPAIEVGRKHGQMARRWSVVFALFAVMTISASYEVFEWLLTVVMSPAHAEAYNGQQGDFWDAQKDMALAFAGSLVTVLLIIICSCKSKKVL